MCMCRWRVRANDKAHMGIRNPPVQCDHIHEIAHEDTEAEAPKKFPFYCNKESGYGISLVYVGLAAATRAAVLQLYCSCTVLGNQQRPSTQGYSR